jgi:hypothetical protein
VIEKEKARSLNRKREREVSHGGTLTTEYG